jgi:DNA-binding PadR family transcriptional regulator
MTEPVLTYPGYRIAKEFARDICGEHNGFDIANTANINEGTLYPLLHRWEQIGWLISRTETPDERQARPGGRLGRKGQSRKLWKATAEGQKKIPAYVKRWEAKSR